MELFASIRIGPHRPTRELILSPTVLQSPVPNSMPDRNPMTAFSSAFAAAAMAMGGSAIAMSVSSLTKPRRYCTHGGFPRRGKRSKPVVAAAAQTMADSGRAESGAADGTEKEPLRVLLLGGAGRIGTAAAVHLARRWLAADTDEKILIMLAGRDAGRGEGAVKEIVGELEGLQGVSCSFQQLDWTVPGALYSLLAELRVDALLHTAGPFDSDPNASVLEASIRAKVPVYVDVADPMNYIASARALSEKANESDMMALVSAGAFPGFSNVLAVECARRLCPEKKVDMDGPTLQDLHFAYFTAGLGGSGPVNLLITNLGFGEPVPVFREGQYAPQMDAGAGSRSVRFFTEEGDVAFNFVGERDVWNWPFPEAATVSEHLKISGDSSTGMGTAPGIWNTILVALVRLVPRDLWRERWFSESLAWFSLPMVWVTDQFVNETHAMRVEATSSDGRKCVAVQTHQSFRTCVAQSTAEFALDLLERRRRRDEDGVPWKPGVWLPEELADDDSWRPGLLHRLSSTEGTVSCDIRIQS